MGLRLTVAAVAVALFALPAAAAPLEEGLGGGPRIDVAGTFLGSQDQFVRRGGHGVHLSVRPLRFVGFDLLVAGFPDLGEGDYTPLTRDLRNATEIVPDISRVLGMGNFGLQIAPLVGRLRPIGDAAPTEIAWYWVIGGGIVATQDDMQILRSPCLELADAAARAADPECSVVDQVHPAFVVGSGIRTLIGGGLLVGFEARLSVYEEQTRFGGPTATRRVVWFGVNVGGSIQLQP